MKQYIGTKIVNAQQMNRGEYNIYRGWTIPENENPEDDGYLIKYPDGYITWSPKQQFDEAYTEIGNNSLYETCLLMESEDFKDRFKAEYIQLKIRCDGLKSMLEKYKNGTLPFKPKCSVQIFNKQLSYMSSYLAILEERAKIEDIKV